MTAETYTATTLARLLGLHRSRIGQLAKAGVLKKREDGRYDASAVAAYVEYVRQSGARRTDYSEEIDAEKVRKLRRENDEAEGLVAPIQVLTDALEQTAAVVIPILENIPLNLKRSFPELTGDQIQVIKAAIAEARNAIADAEIEI